jgi:hypothetical protein
MKMGERNRVKGAGVEFSEARSTRVHALYLDIYVLASCGNILLKFKENNNAVHIILSYARIDEANINI